mgnify:CR=1 FL=1
MENQPKKSPQIFTLTLSFKDDLDGLKKLVELFSYQWKIQGRVPNVLRNKLVVLLSLYLKYGFTKKTKTKASDILKVGIAAVNSMNLELRTGNYLTKDTMNTRINHLHPDLVLLKNYMDTLNVSGESPLVLFKLKADV